MPFSDYENVLARASENITTIVERDALPIPFSQSFHLDQFASSFSFGAALLAIAD